MPYRAQLGELALAALDRSREPAVILDSSLNWLYVNSAAAALFGGEPPAVDFPQCCSTLSMGALPDAVIAALASREEISLQVGGMSAAVSVLAPGTALVSFELASAEAATARLFDALPYGVLIADSSGRIQQVNRKLAELLGCNKEDLECRTLQSITHPEEAVLGLEMLSRLGARERVVPMNRRYLNSAGEPVPVRIWAWIEISEAGGPPRTVLICEGLTAERLMMRDLQQSEWRFRSLVEGTEDMVAILRADGEVVYRNPAAEHWLSTGDSFFDSVHPDDVDAARRELSACLTHYGSSTRIELRLRAEDGSWRGVDVSLRNLLHNPAIAGLVAVGRDATERLETMQRLRTYSMEVEARNRDLAAQLGTGNRSVAALARTLANEFQTPLNGISGLVDLLLGTPLAGPRREALERVRDSTLHLRALLPLLTGEPEGKQPQ